MTMINFMDRPENQILQTKKNCSEILRMDMIQKLLKGSKNENDRKLKIIPKQTNTCFC